jgi:hypothetical protein
MKKFLLVLFLSTLSAFAAYAQVSREDVEKSVKVYFRQSESKLDVNYMGNKAALLKFAEEVKMYYNDPTARFGQVHIISGVSPEGTKQINDHIARMRAQAIVSWINNEIKADVGYRVETMGVDWEKLTEMVEADVNVPYRDEVLDVLVNLPVSTIKNGVESTPRYTALRSMRNGVPYKYIFDNLFSQMRFAAARIEFWREAIPVLSITSEVPLRFPAEGGKGLLAFTKSVEDNIVPPVECPAEWIQSLTSSANNATFDVAPNDSTEPRTTTISLKYYDKVYDVPVEQEGKKEPVVEKVDPVMTLTSASTVDFAATGGKDVIAYQKNVADDVIPTATASEDWIESITPTAEGISYTVAQNTVQEPRTATITVESYGQQHVVTVNQAAAEPACKPFYMGIKTNMLYDLGAIPNIGAEFYLGANFSVVANWEYSWWKSDKKSWYWRSYGGDVALRYWLGKASRNKPLTGHHLGLYGQMITYDFEVGGRGYIADSGFGKDKSEDGTLGWNWAAGLEYGYSLPIARRLNIDFTLGVGYHWGNFKEYLPIDGHYVWQATKRRQYIGPTKLEVSLVWLIGCDNYNKKYNKKNK